MRYPDSRFRSGSMRRRKDQGRRTRNARPSAGYAILTSTNSRTQRNATHTRSTRTFGAIRPFLVISNLGCEGVNRRCPRATRNDWLQFARSFKNVGKSHAHESGKHRVDGKTFVIPGCALLRAGPESIATVPATLALNATSVVMDSGFARRRAPRNDGTLRLP